MTQLLLPPPHKMLPLPPQYERAAPEQIPTDRRFKEWSERACCKWPPELQVAAYYLYEHWTSGFRTKYPLKEARERFVEAYTRWWTLPEYAKDALLPHSFRDSIRRKVLRSKAREFFR